MPSLHDIAHGGSYQQLVCQEFTAEQSRGRAGGTVHQGRQHGPSITYKIIPALLGHSPPDSQAGNHVGPSNVNNIETKAKTLRYRSLLSERKQNVLIWSA
jgi:hypothetical protein